MHQSIEDLCNRMLTYVNKYRKINDANDARLRQSRENNNQDVVWSNLNRIYRYPKIKGGLQIRELVPWIRAIIKRSTLNWMSQTQKGHLYLVTVQLENHLDKFEEKDFSAANRILRGTIGAVINTMKKLILLGEFEYLN